MMRRLVTLCALAAVIFGAATLATTSSARLTSAQKSFAEILQNDVAVDPAVKLLLRGGGFVEAEMIFADLTGEGKSDAIVAVNSGAISGTVATYVLSAERGRKLKVVHVDESGYQVNATVDTKQGNSPQLVLEDPSFALGDPPCCPRSVVRRTYSWDSRAREFKLDKRERVRTGIKLSR